MNYIELRLKVAEIAAGRAGAFEKNFNEIYSKVIGEHPELITTLSIEAAVAGFLPDLFNLLKTPKNGKSENKV